MRQKKKKKHCENRQKIKDTSNVKESCFPLAQAINRREISKKGSLMNNRTVGRGISQEVRKTRMWEKMD